MAEAGIDEEGRLYIKEKGEAILEYLPPTHSSFSSSWPFLPSLAGSCLTRTRGGVVALSYGAQLHQGEQEDDAAQGLRGILPGLSAHGPLTITITVIMAPSSKTVKTDMACEGMRVCTIQACVGFSVLQLTADDG